MKVKKMAKTIDPPNFLELTTAEEANNVDLNIYRFERYSDSKRAYIFVKRTKM